MLSGDSASWRLAASEKERSTMVALQTTIRRSPLVKIALVLGVAAMLVGLPWSARGAQEGTPLPPGAVGVSAAVLGAFPATGAPGYELQVFRSEWAPGSSINTHTHPGALVSCVESGELTFAIQTGAATMIRAHGVGTPAPTEALTLNQPITYGPGDCVAFDQDAVQTVHTAWNAGSEPVVLWEAHLYHTGEAATTFTDAQGTPTP
jgi:hypothetical protein